MNRKTFESTTGGKTLLELMVVIGLLSILSLLAFEAFWMFARMSKRGDVKAELQQKGREALKKIVEELQQSGFVENGTAGNPLDDYPYIFTDGNALAPYSSFAHTPAQHQAESGSSADGPTREIVFRLPEDKNNDGMIYDDKTGRIEWGNEEFAYVLVTGKDGVNRLERRIHSSGAQVGRRVLAEDVERVIFDSIYTDSSVQYNQIVVTLFLRRKTEDGAVTVALATSVDLRNSDRE
jgi:Tfp pilus assembly protein PilE